MFDMHEIGFGVFGILFSLFYLGIFAFMIWLLVRFVSAHESMSESLREIAHQLRQNRDGN